MGQQTGVQVYVLDADVPEEDGDYITFVVVPRVGETFVDARDFPGNAIRVYRVEEVRHVVCPFRDPDQVEVQIVVRALPDPTEPSSYLRRLGPSSN